MCWALGPCHSGQLRLKDQVGQLSMLKNHAPGYPLMKRKFVCAIVWFHFCLDPENGIGQKSHKSPSRQILSVGVSDWNPTGW